MSGSADELGEEKVRPVGDGCFDCVAQAGARVEHEEPTGGRLLHTSERGNRVVDPARQRPHVHPVADGANEPKMEGVGGDDRARGVEIGQPSGDGEERQMVVDDDHSVDTQVRVVDAQAASGVRDRDRFVGQCRVDHIVAFGEVEGVVDDGPEHDAPT